MAASTATVFWSRVVSVAGKLVEIALSTLFCTSVSCVELLVLVLVLGVVLVFGDVLAGEAEVCALGAAASGLY